MKTYYRFLYMYFALCFLLPSAYGQEEPERQGNISFFLDCFHCDFTFVRQELPFVSFVREPQLADVHILVTESETGGGGNRFFLNFIGLKDFKGSDFEYIVTTNQSDTDDDVRKALLKMIKIGILPYYSKTSFVDQLNIDLEESGEKTADDMFIDRWNKWVFSLESGADFQKEESQNEYSIDNEARAERITEEWKTSLEASYEINRENYFDDGVKITNKQDTKQVQAEIIKSLNEKWSAGIFGNYSSQTFLNIKNNFGTAAGIQYNFFPWKECNRRVFAIGYGLGLNIYDYNEVTLYEKMHETYLYGILILDLKLIQPWGEISVGLEGQNLFRDFSKNHLTLQSDISLRLTKNLSVNFGMESRLIHDQLYLPKGDASLEDILLKRRKLATTYELSGRIGFRFTFGSIYNNLVNERF